MKMALGLAVGLLGALATPAERALTAAIGAHRREPTVARRDAVLRAIADVEGPRALAAAAARAPVDGRWALLFSTQAGGAAPAAAGLFDAAQASVYATIFRLAPFLAGGQEGATDGLSVSNVQTVRPPKS